MIVADPCTFVGRRADGVIEVGILQADIHPGQHLPQHAGQVLDFFLVYEPEACHVPPGIDVSAERRRRRIGLQSNEVLGRDHDPGAIGQFFFQALAEDAFAELIVVPQGIDQPVAVLAGGQDRIYPSEHEDLLFALLETGAAISTPGFKARDWYPATLPSTVFSVPVSIPA